jgi:Xaa-Pro aminopeptidase
MRARLKQAVDAMKSADVDCLVLTPGADMFYLTGFEHGHAMERLLALVVRVDGSARWVVPSMNVPQVELHAQPGETVRGWTDTDWYLPALKDAVGGARTIAFDDDARSAFLLDLMQAAPQAKMRRASDVLRGLRLRKEPAELLLLRQAGAQVDRVIPAAVALCKSGRTESEIDEDLKALMLAADPKSAIAFTIVASGPNSALPHHETADRKLQQGDIVILDFGTRVGVPLETTSGPTMSRAYGYQSDITVTCSVGAPNDPEANKVYRTVWEAQQAALRLVKPGVTCEQVDAAARNAIIDAGYGPQFLHRTGHGLGIQGHEPPFIRSGNDQRLEEEMVFSIEPGIYLPGRFGVRLEIIVAASATGADLINAISAEKMPAST